jgi:hypothetical protein
MLNATECCHRGDLEYNVDLPPDAVEFCVLAMFAA